jgi:transcriptional regulator with XRE-family HTH domain
MESLIVGPNEPDNEKFGQLLQKFRTDNQLSRSEAASSIGVTSEYLRLIERGKRAPALGMATKILNFYGVSHTVSNHQIFFGNISISVEFTSRIKESRRRPKVEMTRNELMGEIVSLLSVADDKTVEKIHSNLLRGLLVKET